MKAADRLVEGDVVLTRIVRRILGERLVRRLDDGLRRLPGCGGGGEGQEQGGEETKSEAGHGPSLYASALQEAERKALPFVKREAHRAQAAARCSSSGRRMRAPSPSSTRTVWPSAISPRRIAS